MPVLLGFQLTTDFLVAQPPLNLFLFVSCFPYFGVFFAPYVPTVTRCFAKNSMVGATVARAFTEHQNSPASGAIEPRKSTAAGLTPSHQPCLCQPVGQLQLQMQALRELRASFALCTASFPVPLGFLCKICFALLFGKK